jgi:hypothetical protein
MLRTETDALAFGVAYLGVKDIYSADNSSPQTTELNAKKRAPTLMKWVNIAAVESLVLVWVMTMASLPGHRKWPILGGTMGLVVTYGQYLYAKMCGLQSMEDGTEDWSTPVSTGPHGGSVGRQRGGAK